MLAVPTMWIFLPEKKSKVILIQMLLINDKWIYYRDRGQWPDTWCRGCLSRSRVSGGEPRTYRSSSYCSRRSSGSKTELEEASTESPRQLSGESGDHVACEEYHEEQPVNCHLRFQGQNHVGVRGTYWPTWPARQHRPDQLRRPTSSFRHSGSASVTSAAVRRSWCAPTGRQCRGQPRWRFHLQNLLSSWDQRWIFCWKCGRKKIRCANKFLKKLAIGKIFSPSFWDPASRRWQWWQNEWPTRRTSSLGLCRGKTHRRSWERDHY